MCKGHNHDNDGGHVHNKGDDSSDPLAAPDPLTLTLPPGHVLSHLTDAHCHPTDTPLPPSDYDAVQLGGLAAMATTTDDQGLVVDLGRERGWKGEDWAGGSSSTRVINCFGYHPWFVHRYTLSDSSTTSDPDFKHSHYTSVFHPSPSTAPLLSSLLPYLPDPIPFAPLLEKMRSDIRASLEEGRLTMVGEIGLDGGARCRWPLEAKGVWEEMAEKKREDVGGVKGEEKKKGKAGEEGDRIEGKEGKEGKEEETAGNEGEWKKLTPFKTSMTHQRAIVEAQLEIAVEFGINVSFHSVAAAGATLEVLTLMRDRHRTQFTNSLNVDLHSCGGLSAPSLIQAQRALNNLYFSPSVLVTGRSGKGGEAIRAINKDRMLVESDTHDVREMTRLVWAAAVWISKCKGWKLEGVEGGEGEEGEWEMTEEEEMVWDENGKEVDDIVWTVRTVERNWARFMRLIG